MNQYNDCITDYSELHVTHQILNEGIEGEGDGVKKKYVIEGIFAQCEAKNKNGRVYPLKVMESAVATYNREYVDKDMAVGELNHPPSPAIDYNNVSHKITSLKFEGNNVIGKATLLNTNAGKVAQALLEGGVRLGVSTRGVGTVRKVNEVMLVESDFRLFTIDIVHNPSAHDALVRGIMEGATWTYNNGILTRQNIEEAKIAIDGAGRTYSEEVQARTIKNLLLKLSSK